MSNTKMGKKAEIDYFCRKNRMEDKIFEIINTVLTNRNKETISSISPEMHLGEDIGLDSLDLAELTVRIEAEYDIDIFEDGIVSTVQEVIEKLS